MRALSYPVVRTGAGALFLFGVAGAATGPFQSVVAIDTLGFTDGGYAGLMLAAAFANVVLSVAVGLAADRTGGDRAPMAVAAAAGVLGFAIVWMWPHPWIFALAVTLPLALFQAVNAMAFASVRAGATWDARQGRQIVALLRMMISLAWVLVPSAVAWALSGAPTLLPAYGIAAGAAALCLALVLGGVPARRAARRGAPAVRVIAVLTAPRLMVRVLGVALVSQVLHVNGAVLPLIVTGQAGGTAQDIGNLFGLVAAIEALFMMIWARIADRTGMLPALIAGSVLYLVYLGLMAQATAPWHVYAASVIAGLGAASLVSLPVGYLLDLIEDRPGLSGSLIAVNVFAGGALGAGVFALGTALGGYPAAALLSGAAGLAGAALLWGLER